jgi:predicted phage gp36 major capsid-like protein
VLLVVLLGVAATFIAYKISNDHRVAEQQSRIEALERDLKAKNQELTTAKDDLGAADECLTVVRDLLNSPDEDSARKAVRLMVVKCGD